MICCKDCRHGEVKNGKVTSCELFTNKKYFPGYWGCIHGERKDVDTQEFKCSRCGNYYPIDEMKIMVPDYTPTDNLVELLRPLIYFCHDCYDDFCEFMDDGNKCVMYCAGEEI